MTRQTGTYNEQLSVRKELAFENQPYHPETPMTGYSNLAPRYNENGDWGMLKLSESAVLKAVQDLSNSPPLGSILLEHEPDWLGTEEQVQIGVIWPKDHLPSAVYMRGLGCAPKHLMEVCLSSDSPSAAHAFQSQLISDEKTAVHTRLSQVMFRLASFASAVELGLADGDDSESFGISASPTDVEHFITATKTGQGASGKWAARIYAPQRGYMTGIVNPEADESAKERGWKMGEAIFTNTATLYGDEELIVDPWDIEEAAANFQPKELPPIYKDKRTVLHINLGGDFWVEETRCPSCAQRLIIHAPSSMCPSGRPVGLTIKCGSCNHSFGWP